MMAVYNRYTKTMELIQQVEINQVLGVDKFYFYNCSVGSDVNSLLNYYQQVNGPFWGRGERVRFY